MAEDDDDQTIVFCKVFSDSAEESLGLHYEAGVYEYLQKVLTPEDPLRDNFVDLLCVLRHLTFQQLVDKVVGRYGVTQTTLLRNLMIMQCGDPESRPALDDQSLLDPEDIPECSSRDPSYFTAMRYTIIVTKKPPGNVRSLLQFVKDPRVPQSEKRATLATTIFANARMHALGLSHNDQHWENILATTMPEAESVPRVYSYQGSSYAIRSRTQPRLFDWDRSQRSPSHGEDNRALNGYDLYRPKYSLERDWLTFYRELHQYRTHIGNLPDQDALFFLFFRADTPSAIAALWRTAMRRRDRWAFARKSTFRHLRPHVSVDISGLLRALGYPGVEDPPPLSHYVARERYSLPVLLAVDWGHVHKLLESVDSWDQILRLVQKKATLRAFLVTHSPAFRTLKTTPGRMAQITRLQQVVHSLHENPHFMRP